MTLLTFIRRRWPRHRILTVVCVVVILYLTLMPKPLPDNDIELIPGIDKVAHFIMFGGLAFVAVMDSCRRRAYRFATLSKRAAATVAILVTVFALATELAQQWMNMGRAGDIVDLLADAFGALVGVWIGRRLCRSLASARD